MTAIRVFLGSSAAAKSFEFGYFYGHFGKPRVAIIKYGDYYTPSDLGGYIHVFGSSYFKRGSAVAVGKRTEREFERWIAQLEKA
jgi:predicted nucleotide-binding protein